MPSEILTIIDLLTRPEFLVGLAGGGLALVCLLVTPSRFRDWGLAATLAATLALVVTGVASGGFILGIGLLVVGGALIHRSQTTSDGRRDTLGWIVIVTGALVVPAAGGVARTLWLQTLTGAVIVIGGYSVSRWEQSVRFHLLGLLFAISAGGIWLTVPETEGARALLGVSAAMVVATLPWFGTRINPAGAFPLVAVAAWVAATGGITREASIVGGWACLGLLVLLPLAGADPGRMRGWTVVAIHGVFVVIASRVVGMWESAAVAMIAVAVVSVLSLLTIRLIVPASDQGP